jgi:hypothetical protein
MIGSIDGELLLQYWPDCRPEGSDFLLLDVLVQL